MTRQPLTDEELTRTLEESLEQGFLLLMGAYNERIY